MPYFADRGYDTYAISFRCQGSSDTIQNAKSAGTLASHSADIQHFVKSLEMPPVIMAHSFGGLVAQRYDPMTLCPCHGIVSTFHRKLLVTCQTSDGKPFYAAQKLTTHWDHDPIACKEDSFMLHVVDGAQQK